MVDLPSKEKKPKERKSIMSKEFFVGLLAVVLGLYNILAFIGTVSWGVEIPQLIGSIVLVLAGLLLWWTAYKLSRYKYHTSRLF